MRKILLPTLTHLHVFKIQKKRIREKQNWTVTGRDKMLNEEKKENHQEGTGRR